MKRKNKKEGNEERIERLDCQLLLGVYLGGGPIDHPSHNWQQIERKQVYGFKIKENCKSIGSRIKATAAVDCASMHAPTKHRLQLSRVLKQDLQEREREPHLIPTQEKLKLKPRFFMSLSARYTLQQTYACIVYVCPCQSSLKQTGNTFRSSIHVGMNESWMSVESL